jgi:hypothetical protein
MAGSPKITSSIQFRTLAHDNIEAYHILKYAGTDEMGQMNVYLQIFSIRSKECKFEDNATQPQANNVPRLCGVVDADREKMQL